MCKFRAVVWTVRYICHQSYCRWIGLPRSLDQPTCMTLLFRLLLAQPMQIPARMLWLRECSRKLSSKFIYFGQFPQKDGAILSISRTRVVLCKPHIQQLRIPKTEYINFSIHPSTCPIRSILWRYISARKPVIMAALKQVTRYRLGKTQVSSNSVLHCLERC